MRRRVFQGRIYAVIYIDNSSGCFIDNSDIGIFITIWSVFRFLPLTIIYHSSFSFSPLCHSSIFIFVVKPLLYNYWFLHLHIHFLIQLCIYLFIHAFIYLYLILIVYLFVYLLIHQTRQIHSWKPSENGSVPFQRFSLQSDTVPYVHHTSISQGVCRHW